MFNLINKIRQTFFIFFNYESSMQFTLNLFRDGTVVAFLFLNLRMLIQSCELWLVGPVLSKIDDITLIHLRLASSIHDWKPYNTTSISCIGHIYQYTLKIYCLNRHFNQHEKCAIVRWSSSHFALYGLIENRTTKCAAPALWKSYSIHSSRMNITQTCPLRSLIGGWFWKSSEFFWQWNIWVLMIVGEVFPKYWWLVSIQYRIWIIASICNTKLEV